MNYQNSFPTKKPSSFGKMCLYELSNMLIKDEVLLFCTFKNLNSICNYCIITYPTCSGTYLCFVFDQVCLQGRPYLSNYPEDAWYTCARQAGLPNLSSSTLHVLCTLTALVHISYSLHLLLLFLPRRTVIIHLLLPTWSGCHSIQHLPSSKCCQHWFFLVFNNNCTYACVISFNI